MSATGAARARLAHPDDIAELAGLYRAAVEELSGLRGGAVLIGLHSRQEPFEASFAAQLQERGHAVVVGELALLQASPTGVPGDLGNNAPGGSARTPSEVFQVVGYGACRTVPMKDGTVVGEVEDIFVTHRYRRHGAGRAICNILLEWCQAQNCVGVDAWALPGSRAVKSFFEGGHFTARALVMHHKL